MECRVGRTRPTILVTVAMPVRRDAENRAPVAALRAGALHAAPVYRAGRTGARASPRAAGGAPYGYTPSELLERGLQASHGELLTKPLDPGRLLTIVPNAPGDSG